MADDSGTGRLHDALVHLHSGGSLGDCLSECLAVGVALGAAELRAWASHELVGYPPDAEVPAYRRVRLRLIGVERMGSGGTATAPVSVFEFQDQYRHLLDDREHAVRDAAGDLESFLGGPEDHHRHYIPVNHVFLDHPKYTELFWGVPRDDLEKIPTAVRDEAVARLDALDTQRRPRADETGRAAGADQAVAVLIHGKRHKVNVNTTGVGVPGDDTLARRSLRWTRWQVYVGLAGILVAVVGVVFAYLALR